MPNEPRIVAELGRPETPEETAARKAEASRTRRANQTGVNLVLALAASLGIVLFLVLVVVRPDQGTPGAVDWSEVAAQAQGAVTETLADPTLPPEWSANSANLDQQADGITSWSIGFVTPDTEFIGLRQGIDANETWVDNLLQGRSITSETEIDGVPWTVYDHRDDDDPGNLAYALATVSGASTIVLYGTGNDADFVTLATALDAQLSLGDAEGAP